MFHETLHARNIYELAIILVRCDRQPTLEINQWRQRNGALYNEVIAADCHTEPIIILKL